MKKLISFSLWGNDQKYTRGAIENIRLQKQFYKGWTCRFYIHAKSVHPDLISFIHQEGGEVILKSDDPGLENYSTNGIHMGWFWRFDVMNDPEVERFIIRDIDSRLSLRERVCVKDWEMTKSPFHIIRDNKMHGVPMLAGTWGATKEFSDSIDYKNLLDKFIKDNPVNNPAYGGYDQFFLSTIIYPLIKNKTCVHDDFFNYEPQKRKIPHIRTNNEFIGQPINI